MRLRAGVLVQEDVLGPRAALVPAEASYISLS